MCKFCDLTILNEEVGEMAADPRLARIKDGSPLFDLYLSRYIVEEADIHRASLIMDLEVKLGDGEYTLKNKEVNIKYCPFCGKEL